MNSNQKPIGNPRTLSLSKTPTHEEDFADVICAAARGDVRAIGALVAAYYPVLLAQAAEVLGPWQQADAEDVVQDFLVSLFEGRNRFPPKRHYAPAWMVRIVRAIAQTRRHEECGHE
jgi:DNA-directed RNA polymerase specialized sigma24 family protein